jgi:hypothetical protein
MRVAGATALSIDAERTLIMDLEDVFASANDAGITIIGRERARQPQRAAAGRPAETVRVQ